MGLFCFARRAFVTNRYVGIICWEARYCSPTFHGGFSTLPATNVRKYSQDGAAAAGRFVCCHLPNRTLLKVQGQDTSSFLQGIITNDMRQLLEEQSLTAMYSHMLNVQGRILYDILLYRLQGADGGQGVLLECDFIVKDSILKLLKMYKIRRKVSIDDCPDYSVWAVLPQQEILSQEVGQPMISFPEKAIVWEADPRTTKMGWRLVINKETEPSDIIATCQKAETDEYHRHRFTIGIPEGVKDLPPGVALPLESNLVYMQGISFSKGCYIGQELTARTHHTGVIRKRLMPVRFSSPFHNLEDGAALQTQSGKPAGKHRSGVGNHGLGLIRLAHAKEVLTVKSSDDTTLTLEVSVPDWWPKDWNSN